MKRDLQSYVQEYEQKFESTGKGAFYVSDFYQLAELVQDKADKEFYTISYALEAGFIIGYKQAQRDAKKRRKRTSASRV